MTSVGFADCDAMALMGQSNVLSIDRPRKRNFPHTFWMNFLPFLSSGGGVDSCVAYFVLAPSLIGALGKGCCCYFFITCRNCLRAFFT